MYEGVVQSFNDFLLSEAIKPREVLYGLNSPEFNNKMIYNKNGLFVTCFGHPKDKEETVLVAVLNGECSFGTFKTFGELGNHNVLDYIEILSDKKKNNGSPGLKIFNNVFYVLLEIINKHNLNDFWFNAANRDLSVVYSMVVKNKYFLQEMSDFSYSFDSGKHKFRRIKIHLNV